jgi:hypothetical protein
MYVQAILHKVQKNDTLAGIGLFYGIAVSNRPALLLALRGLVFLSVLFIASKAEKSEPIMDQRFDTFEKRALYTAEGLSSLQGLYYR